MQRRLIVSAVAASPFVGMMLLPVDLVAQVRNSVATGASTWTASRLPWGDPDLQGIWTDMNERSTPFERPAECEGKDIDPESPELLRTKQAELDNPSNQEGRFKNLDGRGTGNGPVHWYEGVVGATASRLWAIVDPPSGKVPPLTPEAQRRAAVRAEAMRGLGNDEPRPGHWTEDLSTFVRCITRGLPTVYIPLAYNQNFQILQSPGYVTILYEMMHETRVIPLDGRPHVPPHVRQWLGDPRGRWEGNTLVVDTTNFTDKTDYRGSRENLHLVERFTRVGLDKIDWRVTVEDTTTWMKPWTFALPLTKDDTQQWIFEYGCHEGNYGIRNILSGARARERTAQELTQQNQK